MTHIRIRLIASCLVAAAALGPSIVQAQVSTQGAARPSGSGVAAPLAKNTPLATTIGGVAATFLPGAPPDMSEGALKQGVTFGTVELSAPLNGAPRGAYDLVVTRTANGWTAHLAKNGKRAAPLRYISVNLKPAPASSAPTFQVCPAGCRATMPDKSGIIFSPGIVASNKQYYFDTVTVTTTVLNRDGNPVSNSAVQFSLYFQLSDAFGGPAAAPPTSVVEMLPSAPGTARIVIKSQPLYTWLQARVGNLFASTQIYGYSPPSSDSSSDSNCSTAMGWGSTFCWW